MKIKRLIPAFLFLLLFLLQPIHASANGPLALVLTIDGAITPATQEYLARGLKAAASQNADVVILKLNTPGGGLDPMQKMTTAMRSSLVPVVVYVTPRGAWAGSAGTVITATANIVQASTFLMAILLRYGPASVPPPSPASDTNAVLYPSTINGIRLVSETLLIIKIKEIFHERNCFRGN